LQVTTNNLKTFKLSSLKAFRLQPSLFKYVFYGQGRYLKPPAAQKACHREFGLADADRNVCVNALEVRHDLEL